MKAPLVLLLSLLLIACGNSDPTNRNVDSLSLEALRGQWVVINYWAKWCKPCIKEIPELNELDQHYSQVSVLGVNFDGASGVELEAQIQQLGIEFPILAQDPAPQLQIRRPMVLPTTLILNPEGKLVATLIGPQTLASLAQATGQAALPES